jgi:hypothetical protein
MALSASAAGRVAAAEGGWVLYRDVSLLDLWTSNSAEDGAARFLGTTVTVAGDGLIAVSQFRERGFLWRCVERIERSDRLQVADCFRLERQR